MSPTERALEAVRASARARHAEALSRWQRSGSGASAPELDAACDAISRAGRLTVNFHPDRLARSGLTVAEGMAHSGRYVSQWVTGISNGGRSAFPGGDRQRWEHQLFDHAYAGADPATTEFPIYGAWDLLVDAHGGSPRFGSCFLVLADHVRERVTFCVGDSHAGPTDIGTFDSPWCVLAALAEQVEHGTVLGVPVDQRRLLDVLDDTPVNRGPRRDLDRYVEMQAHGGIDLRTDVDAIVLDPSFQGTDVHTAVTELAQRYDVEIEWHAGSELAVDRIPTDFRGPTMPDVGARAARTDGVVDARSIGVAARAVRLPDMQTSGDPPDSDLQQLKYLWHTLLAFGADASPAPRRRTTGSSTGLGEYERLVDLVDVIAADEHLSGVIRIDREGHPSVQRAYGLAHRGLGVANTVDTRFAIASGAKGFTALTVMSLVETGLLTLDTTAREVLGSDLTLIDDGVTVEHLLGHRSGIGDYLDEDVIVDGNDHLLSVPVHELATTEQFLAVLDGHPTKFRPGERFSYSNGGYVVLALIAERTAGVPFHDLVDQRVCRPAGLLDTAFLRSDEPLGRVALGYLHDEGMRTNVFHLPVRGNGDGGIYTTATDVRAFWDALYDGRIVSPDTVTLMTRPTGDVPEMSMQYGLGFWLPAPVGAVSLHGFDAGVGFVTVHDHERRVTYTVLCNQSRGAWPVAQRLAELLAT